MPGLGPGIHEFAAPAQKSWMAGTSPAMTERSVRYDPTAPLMTGPKICQRAPSNFIICICSIGK